MAGIDLGMAKETKQVESQENVKVRDRAYRLEYRYKNRFQAPGGKVQSKVFWFKGNLKEAVNRVRLHCERMDYVYVFCHPYIVDLDAQEDMKNKDLDGEFQDEY